MDIHTEIQFQLFREISLALLPGRSLAEEVAGILGISTDSVYRRMNGQKSLSLDEFYLLCHTFRISADKLFKIHAMGICFDSYVLDEEKFGFEAYLHSIMRDFESVAKCSAPEIIFMLNELNLLQVLQFPEIAAFKFFFWAKSNMQFKEYQDITYSIKQKNQLNDEIVNRILKPYIQIPSTELFTAEILNSVLKQINYYYISGFFNDRSDAIELCNSLFRLVEHLKQQAELGYKFRYGTKPEDHGGTFICYYNDLVLTDNTILVSSHEQNLTYITANAINLMKSDHPGYFRQNQQWAHNIINRSTLVSGTAERERNKLFRDIVFQIQKCQLQLEE